MELIPLCQICIWELQSLLALSLLSFSNDTASSDGATADAHCFLEELRR